MSCALACPAPVTACWSGAAARPPGGVRRWPRAAAVPLVRVEDAFLRSLHPGPRRASLRLACWSTRSACTSTAAPRRGSRKSLPRTTCRIRTFWTLQSLAIARLKHLDLSKYNIHDPDLPIPDPGYVLVIDQTRGDASIRHGGASEATFRAMLEAAKQENPDARIVIRSHPETMAGLRPGHFGAADAHGRVTLLTAPVSPHRLLAGAAAVYTVSSQLGFEAILHGHRPHVFGQPFYAGWGLSRGSPAHTAPHPPPDATAAFRRGDDPGPALVRPLPRPALQRWIRSSTSWRPRCAPSAPTVRAMSRPGMRLWKRSRLQAFFGGTHPLRFRDDPARRRCPRHAHRAAPADLGRQGAARFRPKCPLPAGRGRLPALSRAWGGTGAAPLARDRRPGHLL